MQTITPSLKQSTRNAITRRMERALAEAHIYTFVAIRGRDYLRCEGGSATYEVHRGGHSNCPDFLHRGSQEGYACKHLLLLASGAATVRQESDAEYAARTADQFARAASARKMIEDLFPAD